VEMAAMGVNSCCLEMQSHDPIKTWLLRTISMDIEVQLSSWIWFPVILY
jgi:hypothetical protein